jgi:hypothetical protein
VNEVTSQGTLGTRSNLFFNSRLDEVISELSRINKCSCLIPIAIGIVVSLGGIFLLLAYYQILPHGINAMSGMGVWGQVVGYGVVGSGLVITALAVVKGCAPAAPKSTFHPQEFSDIEGKTHESPIEEQEQQEQRATAATSLQGASRSYLAKQELEILKKKRNDAAVTVFQKHCRGYLIRERVKKIKEHERAVTTIQSIIRMHVAQKIYEQKERHMLSYFLFERARTYTEDSVKLANAPKAPQGACKYKIYMPQDVPVVIRECANKSDFDRFPQMTQARAICSENNLHHVVVPKARQHGNFIIEERLPNDNASTIKGMVFYYENRAAYTEVVEEFTSFLCFGYLSDIVGDNKHIINYLMFSEVPRFDNLLLYFTEHGKEKLYNIGIVDLETFELNSLKPSAFQVYQALASSVQLFPYHFNVIIERGKKFCNIEQKEIVILSEKCLRSRELYKIVCEGNLSFYQKHNITLQNQILISLTLKRREVLKEHMGSFVRNMHDHGLKGYFGVRNCLNGNPDANARRFQEELCPKMISLVEKMFNNIFSSSSKVNPPISYGELIERRMVCTEITSALQRQFTESDSYALVKEIFKDEYPPTFPIFEEILKQLVKDGELSYYQAHIYGSKDLIFF